MAMIAEFKAFLLKSNALALAVGVVIGAAVGKVVSSIVGDLIMPIVGLLTPSGDFRSITVGPKGEFKVGNLMGALLDFVIVAFVIFLIVKALMREKPAPPPPPTKDCPHCLEKVPVAATKCRACTSVLA